MKRYGFILMSVLGLWSLTGSAQTTTYVMGSFPIPLMVEDQEHGVFVEIFHEVVKRLGEPIILEIYPTQRAQKLFTEKAIIGFFPASDKSAGENAAKSRPFYSKKNVVFVRNDASYITEVAQLEGKIVGLTKGYTYGPEITENPNITVEYADSDVLNMRKLSKGRLDAFIVEEQSGLKAVEESGVSDVIYDPHNPLSAIVIFFAFQDDEEGRLLAEKFSAVLTAMENDGSFDAIMKKAQ